MPTSVLPPRPSITRPFVGAFAFLALWLSAGCGGRGVEREFADSVRVVPGSAGRVQVGTWNPIVVQATSLPAETLHPEVVAPDPDGLPVRFVLPDLTPDGSRGEFLIGQIDSPIRVEFVPSGKPGAGPVHVVTLTTRNSDLQFLKPDVRFWGVYEGDAPLRKTLDTFVEELTATGPASAIASPIEIRTVPVTEPRDLDGLDALFAGADTLRSLAYEPGRAGDRLRAWLSGGGQLVVVARGAPADYAQPQLTDWFPIQVDPASAPIRFRDLVILSQGVNRGLLRTPREGAPGVKMTAPTGRVLSTSLDGDLLVRAPFGRGSVTMLAINPDDAPLKDWDGLPSLLAGLVDFEVSRESLRQRTNLNPTGISDLQTQILRTTNDFPAVARPSYWSSLGLILLAFLVVGPVDYFLVHHLLKRPHWTWFTLTAWVALLTFAGVTYAQRTTGSSPLANQIDLVDVDESQKRIGTRTWYTLYSPSTQRIDLAIDPAAAWPVGDVSARDIHWSGRPEAGFRGMHRPGGLNLGDSGYAVTRSDEDSNAGIERFPLRAGSTCDVEAEWEGDLSTSLVQGNLEGDLKSRFRGTFTVNLPGDLTDWFIAYGRFAYHAPLERRGYGIMTLKPGASVDIAQLQAKMFTDYLTGVVSTSRFRANKQDSDYTFSRQVYDPTGIDPYEIFKMISFYKTAGGKTFTTLTNGPVMSLDRSNVVTDGQAVLFGRLDTPASQVSVDEAKPKLKTETFVRVILPVKQIETDYSFPVPEK